MLHRPRLNDATAGTRALKNRADVVSGTAVSLEMKIQDAIGQGAKSRGFDPYLLIPVCLSLFLTPIQHGRSELFAISIYKVKSATPV